MNQFIVHVERNNLAHHTVLINEPGQRLREARFTNIFSIELKGCVENDMISSMETWYADTMENAEQLARILAKECPGRNINVYELKSVTKSLPGDPIRSIYNEKGLVPS